MYSLLDTEPRSDVMQTHQIEQAFLVKKCSSKKGETDPGVIQFHAALSMSDFGSWATSNSTKFR